jgi:hypothetical protein
MSGKTRATTEDLYKVGGNAEPVNGEIVCMPPAGDDQNGASLNVPLQLRCSVGAFGSSPGGRCTT